MSQKPRMETLYTYLKSAITLLPLLGKGGLAVTIVLVIGWLVCKYLEYRTAQEKMKPELLRAEGDKAVRMAEAKVIRARANSSRKGLVRKSLDKDRQTTLGVEPSL